MSDKSDYRVLIQTRVAPEIALAVRLEAAKQNISAGALVNKLVSTYFNLASNNTARGTEHVR